MRKANRNTGNDLIARRLAETRMNDYDRTRAMEILQSAQRVADGIIWIKDKFSSLGQYFLKPGLKH